MRALYNARMEREGEHERLLPSVVPVSPAAGRRQTRPPTLLEPARVVSVADLTTQIRQLLEGAPQLQQVRVQGEVADYRGPASSGHHYFALKDADAQISCVIWAGTARNLRLGTFSTGDQVILTGDLRLYAPRGTYQLSVTDFERAGQGAAWIQFLELKAQLEAEGLFAPERKQSLPLYPRCIGIVTSTEAAALRDILKILRRRAPHIPVRIAPALVQGPLAAPALQKALYALAQEPTVDVIILARGGGSYEDLACFNDEALVRALAQTSTPVVTGVGHETDFTLVDFVSDLRAPTPTAAAALVSPDVMTLTSDLHEQMASARQTLERRLRQAGQHLSALMARPVMARPARELEDRRQQVDELLERAGRQLSRRLAWHQQELEHLGRLRAVRTPARRLAYFRQRLDQTALTRLAHLRSQFTRRQERLEALVRLLAETHPSRLLQRGYALVRNEAGQIVSRVQQVQPDQTLIMQLSDGSVPVRVAGPPIPAQEPTQP